MKREEYSARLHKEMEPVRVSRQLRARTLAALCQGEDVRRADTEGFLRAIRMKLEA